jgi:hypothetical protein
MESSHQGEVEVQFFFRRCAAKTTTTSRGRNRLKSPGFPYATTRREMPSLNTVISQSTVGQDSQHCDTQRRTITARAAAHPFRRISGSQPAAE